MSDVTKEQAIYLYNGVLFLADRQKTSIGRRFAIHDFPYSSQEPRYVEDLGKAQREFQMTALITNDYPFKNGYEAAKTAFKLVLENTSIGVLLSKWSGLALSVRLVSHVQITESDDAAGVAQFKLHFSQTTSDIPPFNLASSASVISDGAPVALEAFRGIA